MTIMLQKIDKNNNTNMHNNNNSTMYTITSEQRRYLKFAIFGSQIDFDSDLESDKSHLT